MSSFRVAVTLLGLTVLADSARAEEMSVPNGSFESPATPFVSINIDHWQKGPKPDWYVEAGGFFWGQLIGGFKNTAPGQLDHLDNCDGAQALWLFAVPEVSLFQDHDSVDWNDPAPTHAFNARFEVGKSYVLTVGVNGGGGGMLSGVTMEISLYYRDAANNRVTVSATIVTNTPENFPNHTHFNDYQVQVPTVKPTDAWAGQYIGIHMLSTVAANLQGGYWDLDHVRLSSVLQPSLTGPSLADGQMQFSVMGEPGWEVQILASTDVTAPISSWTNLGTLTNLTGTVSFSDGTANNQQRFYQALQLP